MRDMVAIKKSLVLDRKKGVFWKRGLFRKVHCLENLEILEILEILEMLEILEIPPARRPLS